MSQPFATRTDVRFVALIHADQDRFHVDCFYEIPSPVQGFGAETETIHRSVVDTLQTAESVAIAVADEHGFSPAEIVWS